MSRMPRALAILLFALITLPAAADDWARRMFSETSHDFRNVGRGAKAEYYFEFTNPYKEEVRVASVRTSCGCTTPTLTKNVLRSRETAAVIAKLNTETHIGDKSAVLTVVFDRPYYSEVQLSVRGHIRTDVVFSPAEINFGEMVAGEVKTQNILVTHTGNTHWEIRDVRSHCADLSVSLSPPQRSPGMVRYRMNVATKATLAQGDLREVLTLVTNDTRFPTIDMAVSGRVRPSVEVSPAALNLGTVPPGETIERRLVVRAEGPFAIERVTCDDPRFEFELPTGEKTLHFIRARFTGAAPAGAINEPLKIFTNFGGGTVAQCVVTGSVAP